MKYTDSHEWIDQEGRVGVSEFAQEELGEVVYVELPKVGSFIEEGHELAVLESTKAAADIYAPVSGEIVEVNERLKIEPDLINRSPEDGGWICKMKVSHEV